MEILEWDDLNDPLNPYNFSKARKWLITIAALTGTLLVSLNGTSIAVAAQAINHDFGISDAQFPNSYWTIASWAVGGTIFIIIFLPLCEDLGVRAGYLIFYVFFILMLVPQALAKNFYTLVITRFFSGGCVTLVANMISSTIPDIWADDKSRNIPVATYVLCYLAGATLGPVVFAGVMEYIGDWRWIFYIQLILYTALLPFFVITMKETRGDVILRRRAKAIRKKTGREVYAANELQRLAPHRMIGRAIYRPIYLLCTEPVLMACTLWSAFCVGTVYLFTQSIEQVFVGIYGWRSASTNYLLGAVVVGECIGWLFSFVGARFYFKSSARNVEMPGRPIPEARLYISILGSFVGLTGGMFVYGWTSYSFLPWIVPSIGLAMVGFGIQIVVTALADYIVDCYAASSFVASAVTAIAATENIFSAFLPLATRSMYNKLGYHWASSLLGFIGLMISFIPLVIVWKGRWLRERSPFMLSNGMCIQY